MIKTFANNNINYYIPSCTTCKWFIPNINEDYGKCKIFGEKTQVHKKKVYPFKYKNQGKEEFILTIYNYAKHCRENENQCGKYAYFYEKNNLMDMDLVTKMDYLKMNNQDLYEYTKFIQNNKKDYFSS
jgi:hypothetical protein